ncbi:MAG: hypothetical protein ACRD12_13200 [Acidimicrobiales bacterium]
MKTAIPSGNPGGVGTRARIRASPNGRGAASTTPAPVSEKTTAIAGNHRRRAIKAFFRPGPIS